MAAGRCTLSVPGSSPRVRGDLGQAQVQRPRVGLIPACAGRPTRSRRAKATTWAHPRVCGATTDGHLLLMRQEGSSPRVRGDRRPAARARDLPGLIPACAGRPCGARCRTWTTGAHPRVCGATNTPSLWTIHTPGSSPRVRGDRSDRGMDSTMAGLIPACAGRPRCWPAGGGSARAHPRVCGATFAPSFQEIQNWGSSPRVRGDLHWLSPWAMGPGLIPACAGRPTGPSRPNRRSWAHPRVCGATHGMRAFISATQGSSPRVRGDRRPARQLRRREGLIPACAGRPPDWP